MNVLLTYFNYWGDLIDSSILDEFKFAISNYALVAISNPIQFLPENYGITPEGRCTACYKGYWCEYKIYDDEIFLQNLYINSKDDIYPEINGVCLVKII